MPRQAPVCTVPPEILTNVFELVHQEEAKKKFGGRYVHCTFPVQISHVSRYFRNVAIQTSTLWTMIYVLDLRDAEVEYIKTCLERSGTLPLKITFECSSWNGGRSITSSAVEKAMSFIQVHLYRLQSLRASFDSNELLQCITRHLDHPAPQLKTLDLSNHGKTPRGFLISFHNEMTQLDHLHLFQVPIEWSQCNFKNLVVFYLHDYSSNLALKYQEFWDIVENSPSLRKLILEYSQFTSGQPAGVANPCVLNSLEELQLITISLNSCLALMSRLHAPNVKALILSHMEDDDYTQFLTRIAGPPTSFSNLRLLDFVFVATRKEAVEALRHAYPQFQDWSVTWDGSPFSVAPRLVLFACSTLVDDADDT